MTTLSKDEILRLAREAGFADRTGVVHAHFQLEKFAQLCRADLVAENERLTRINRDHVDSHNRLVIQSARDSEKINALKGDPGEDRLHDWSDLPKVAGELVAECEQLRDQNTALDAVCATLERERDALKSQLDAFEARPEQPRACASIDAAQLRTELATANERQAGLMLAVVDRDKILKQYAAAMKRGEA